MKKEIFSGYSRFRKDLLRIQPTLMTYYFIKEGSNELGPFSMEQLKSKLIKKETLVWFAGLQEWICAGDVYELKELFTTKLSSRSFSRNIIYKIWDNNPLVQQIKKVS
jgi:GYF domain 2